MNELKKQLEDLKSDIDAAIGQLDLSHAKKQLNELETQMQAPGFWEDNQTAAAVSKQHAALKDRVEGWEGLASQVGEALELAELDDRKLEKDLSKQYEQLKASFEQQAIELKLGGEHDQSGAILQIHAGTGGTDAMDWAQMLERMYLRWAEAGG